MKEDAMSLLNKVKKGTEGFILMAAFTAARAVDAFAGDTNVDWLTSNNGGSFEELETTAKEAMGSFYSLTFTVSTGLCVILLIMAFVKLALYQGQMREQQKGAIFWVIVAMAGITGAISIFSLVAGVSSSVFSS